ncbi:hypothetical protein G6F35_005095 [Rhizopus arrhizus]|nr:hypothetical protein G6F35_005095 [Rhizopus arrhizus]
MAGGAQVGPHALAHDGTRQLQFLVEVDVEQREFAAPGLAREVRTDFIGLGGFGVQAFGGGRQLAVLLRAERLAGVGEQRPLVVHAVEHRQGRQGHARIDRRRQGAGDGAGRGVEVGDVVVGADAFEAHAGRDRPLADVDAVVDVEGVGGGAAVARLVGGHVQVERIAAGGRVVVGGTPGHFRAAFLQVAVADGDFLHERTRIEQARITRFKAEIVIAARRGGQAELVRRGAGAALLDVAAAVGIHVVRQHFEVVDAVIVRVLQRTVGATARELVVLAGRLERVFRVLRGGQAAGHPTLAFEVVQRHGHVVGRRKAVGALQDHVVDVGGIVAGTVAIAMRARIEQRAAQALVSGAAHEQAGRGLDVAAMAVDFAADVQAGREVLRDGARHEVDDAAHVLRAIADRTGAAHHIDRFQVAQRHGRQ